MPFTPGMEGAGVVEAIGPDVTEVNVEIVSVMRCTKVPTLKRQLYRQGCLSRCLIRLIHSRSGGDVARNDGALPDP